MAKRAAISGLLVAAAWIGWLVLRTPGGQADLHASLELLRNGSATERARGVAALRDRDDPLALAILLTAARDPDTRVLREIELAFARPIPPAWIAWLETSGLNSPDPLVRALSLRVLDIRTSQPAPRPPGEVVGPAASALDKALQDPDSRVQLAALEALSAKTLDEATAKLISRLLSFSTRPAVRRHAGALLGRSGKNFGVMTLLDSLAQPQTSESGSLDEPVDPVEIDWGSFVENLLVEADSELLRNEFGDLLGTNAPGSPRAIALRVLGRLRVPEAVPHATSLAKRLKPEEAQLRMIALWTLAELGTADTLKALAQNLVDPDSRVRLETASLLRKAAESASPEYSVIASAALAPLAARETDWRVKSFVEPPAPISPPSAGSSERSRAIASALEYLARTQDPEGFWNPATQNPSRGTFRIEELFDADADFWLRPAVTSLALLCYLGAGNSPHQGPYQEQVRRAEIWLLSQQRPSGLFGPAPYDPAPPLGASLPADARRLKIAQLARWNHLWTTLALGETIYAARAKPQAERLRAFLAAMEAIGSEAGTLAGFLDPRETSLMDLDLIGKIRNCAVVRNRIAFPGNLLQQASGLLQELLSSRTTPLVPWRLHAEGEYWFGGEDSTALAISAILFLRVPNGKALVQDPLAELLQRPPAWHCPQNLPGPSGHPAPSSQQAAGAPAHQQAGFASALRSFSKAESLFWSKLHESEEGPMTNFQAWMARAVSVFLTAEGRWQQELDQLTRILATHQRKSGPERGSWDPVGPWSRGLGRLYSTTLGTLTLEVPDRPFSFSQVHWTDRRPLDIRMEQKDAVDPVCKRRRPKTSMIPFTYKERQFHFDSQACLEAFQADPKKYVPLDDEEHEGE